MPSRLWRQMAVQSPSFVYRQVSRALWFVYYPGILFYFRFYSPLCLPSIWPYVWPTFILVAACLSCYSIYIIASSRWTIFIPKGKSSTGRQRRHYLSSLSRFSLASKWVRRIGEERMLFCFLFFSTFVAFSRIASCCSQLPPSGHLGSPGSLLFLYIYTERHRPGHVSDIVKLTAALLTVHTERS